jgi:hypothetical protein
VCIKSSLYFGALTANLLFRPVMVMNKTRNVEIYKHKAEIGLACKAENNIYQGNPEKSK